VVVEEEVVVVGPGWWMEGVKSRWRPDAEGGLMLTEG